MRGIFQEKCETLYAGGRLDLHPPWPLRFLEDVLGTPDAHLWPVPGVGVELILFMRGSLSRPFQLTPYRLSLAVRGCMSWYPSATSGGGWR